MATLLTPAPATADVPAACPSCGEPLAGEYCHACGERRPDPRRLSARHFFGEMTEDVLDVDSRALRSLRLLVARPGFLTLEYIAGRRRPYLGPLRMYLTVFAALLFVTLLAPKGAPTPRNGLVDGFRRVIHQVAVRRGISDAAAEKAVSDATTQHVAWISVLIPLVFAAFLFAAFHRRRRWFGEHLVFAIHYGTINFLLALALIPFTLLLQRGTPAASVILGALALIPLAVYTAIAVRRVYGTGWPGAAAATLGLFIAFSIAQSVTGLLAIGTAIAQVAWFGA